MKNLILALAVGYVIGAKAGSKEIDQLGRSVTALLSTDEFVDVVTSARSHMSSTLRELAAMVDGEHHRTQDAGTDVLAQVRNLVGSD
jgi:hypothetical protein